MAKKQFRMMMFIPPVDIKYCTVIGQAIVTWGHLDRTLNKFIGHLLAATKTALPVGWERLWLDQRLTLYSEQAALCFAEHPRIITEIESIKSALVETQIDRNLFAHGQISTVFPKGGGGISIHVEGRYKKQDIERNYTLPDIHQINSILSVLSGRLSILTHENLNGEFAPSWSPQELSALQDFRSGNRQIPAR